MERTTHLTVGARGDLPIVCDDEDRYGLIDRVSAALGHALLAYCVMDTHLHVVADGPPGHVRRRLEAGLKAYLRSFNRRHSGGGVLRGPIDARPIADEDELLRTIRYDHDNPVRTRNPLVDRAIDFPWSSARAFAGLSLARAANVARAVARLGPAAYRLTAPRPPLADLEPSRTPSASPEMLLFASADVYGVRPWDLPSPKRVAPLPEARALFLRLGQLESYSVRRLAPFLHRSQQQGSLLVCGVAVAEQALRLARTLLRDRGLRRRLPRGNRPDQTGRSYQSEPTSHTTGP
jgi:hypothetical protein